MNRSKVVIKNFTWELGYYFFVIALGFLAPRLIILTYGSEVNGLSSTITQILSVILLIQSGATTAAVFSLYKPIVEKDIVKINVIINATSRYFKILSYIYFILMFVMAIITSKTISSSIDRKLIFWAFFIMGSKGFLDLYFTSQFRVLFTAYEQKFYMLTGMLIEQIIYYMLMFGAIFLKVHFIFLYFGLFIGCIFKILYSIYICREKHPQITNKFNSNNYIIPGTNYALANEISHSVVSSSILIFISFMYGLEEASVYSVYVLVSSAITLFSTAIYSAFAPSFGNVVAQSNYEITLKTFRVFQFIYISFNQILFMCMLYLLVPFIKIYTFGANDINYINKNLSYLLAICGLISAFRVPYNIIVSSHGLFRQTCLQPVVTSIISLIISYIFGKVNCNLILLGPIVFYLINYIYQYYKLHLYVPYLISYESINLSIISTVGLVFAWIASIYISVPDGIISWILYAAVCFIASCFYVVITTYIFTNKLLCEFIEYIKKTFMGRS